MTAWKLAPAALTLPLLIIICLLGTRMLPASDTRPQPGKSEAAVAEVVVGMSVRSDEFGLHQLHDFGGPPETMRHWESETMPGKKDRRAIRALAAELIYRFEAEIAWQLGRVASP